MVLSSVTTLARSLIHSSIEKRPIGQYIVPHGRIDALRVTPLIRSPIFQPEHAGCRVWRVVSGVLNNTRLAAFVVAARFNNNFLCSVAVTFSSLVQRVLDYFVGDGL